jgi:hypothetical protein
MEPFHSSPALDRSRADSEKRGDLLVGTLHSAELFKLN